MRLITYRRIFWTSEPYKFDVVRYICHQDVDDSLYGWTTVPEDIRELSHSKITGQ